MVMPSGHVTAANAEDKMENLLHLETMFEESGRDDGKVEGEKLGEIEGIGLGLAQGFAFGKEVGFYLGSIIEQAKSFPLDNSETADILGIMDKLRARFRMLTTLLKVPEQKFTVDATAANAEDGGDKRALFIFQQDNLDAMYAKERDLRKVWKAYRVA
ncbi:hypothetical protein HDU76_013987 [Blyttiomyces sp. JEL0837]|nr:hypothetical protein HDU76_013987 [Blyttiomyces sp. JEL0837]